ncbi:unnamed protein product [Effrenium voratum]|uniref:Ankyrin repeat domain-containing protein 1 n=1 Tax=Effrenium voratum TaxID=2562239 RepID=A0AA36IK18_9DINO|nr:unnamed protein product [Effrenium voratum]
MQVIEDSCFEQVGGRCKLKCDPPVSLLKGDIVVAERLKQIRQRRKEREELKRRRQEKNLALVRDFLASNNFDKEDLNAPKVECFGLRKCYPLQRAVKDENMDMVRLLLRFGADPQVKDMSAISS